MNIFLQPFESDPALLSAPDIPNGLHISADFLFAAFGNLNNLMQLLLIRHIRR